MFKCVPIRAFSDNYIWLLLDQETHHGVVVDPGDAKPVVDYLYKNNVHLDAILLTHHHADHVGGVPELLEEYHVPVYGPQYNKLNFVSHPLGNGEKITLPHSSHTFHILTIPGHTLDHIAYYDDQRLFCGDTLFLGGCGRLFEGTAEQMLSSLNTLSQLPDDILVYCAHEYTLQNLKFAETLEQDNPNLSARIKQVTECRKNQQVSIPEKLSVEKQTNPFLRIYDTNFKQLCETKLHQTFADSIELFAAIRAAKDHFQFSEIKYLQTVKDITE